MTLAEFAFECLLAAREAEDPSALELWRLLAEIDEESA